MRALAALVLAALLAQAANAAGALTLSVPRGWHEGDPLWLTVTLGPLPHGQEVDVTTPDGREIGNISPYGTRTGEGTFAVPVPPEAIAHGKLAIVLTLSGFGGPPRAPTDKEVLRVTLAAGL